MRSGSPTRPGCTSSRSVSSASKPDTATATALKQLRSPTFGVTPFGRFPLPWLTSQVESLVTGVAAAVVAAVRRAGGIGTCRHAERERHDEHSEQGAK